MNLASSKPAPNRPPSVAHDDSERVHQAFGQTPAGFRERLRSQSKEGAGSSPRSRVRGTI